MSNETETRLRASLSAIPGLSDYTGPVERLGGMTNLVFRVGDACVRLPGAGTEEYINRTHEAEAARAAAEAGVSPEVIHADPLSGIMATRFIEGAETMTPVGFRADIGSVRRAGEAFRQLHTSGARFPFTFELFAMIDDYLRILSTKDVALPEGYHDVVREAQTVRAALARNPAKLVACHCDPLCENFLDTGERIFIVDWEYSGMNDPMWDLGDLSVEAGFDAEQDRVLMEAYCGGEPDASDYARMVIYKAMCDLLWTLWGLIQLANDNPAEDFRAYADCRFARCRSLMATEEFSRCLKTLQTA
ncbi:MAG: phosphotransferase family protein [Hoeflea sp.]|uniref:phosphotransferase family protein n=1 Tax=Hoeflea sp. TaxID=1940281 RepID=UPI001DF14992|nr:phosphotransferase family protein [Hoeflea sp.]MBU4528123.1 phosphotransferase family protein [Alphaproteobacteria bacterium]MBU4543719.1 phosphotransferase family protein [Alphaproteobacteria bacterium]MBU4548586.1 phosphotransferase family protein [Alphaproteobacteria bacterium]MBV1725752.1 phosphotransferase family protein [Hoeflea sp.]MBV1762108.1 phosphotransferase family protein [Hoeflea sp.]